MSNTDRLINHQDGLNIVTQLDSIASAISGNYSSIAPKEVSPTANEYAQGDLLFFNGPLYKTKTDIAVGTTLVVDTNIEETTIEEEIKNIAASSGVTGVKGNEEANYRTGNVNITPANIGAIASIEKGTASGVAELDSNGKVPSSQLPSYVDDVKEGYLNSADGKFYEESTYETEITPEADKIYVDKATNITYRWSGSAFVAIGSDLALGETSTTAYRGDRGKAAYDHATDANKISAATASGFYKVGATAEGHVSSLTAVAKADITALGIPDADDLGTAAAKDVAASGDASASQVVMGNDSRLTDARNAADVSAWAKADTKPTYTASEVGLGNVGNFKAVSTEASQDLTDTEKANARTNIGAGTSSFSGAYNDLTGKPTLGTAAAKDFTASVTSGSADVVTSGAVYTYVDTVITQALNGSY